MMVKFRSYMALLAVICLVVPVTAADSGGYAGAFLQLSVQPRAAGMGNAYTAVADDATGLFFNPAAAAQIRRFTFGGAYRDMSLDRSLQQLAIIFPVRDEAAIGISAELASMSGIQGRTSKGEPTEELDNLDAVISITFARKFSDIVSLGGNARYYHKKLVSESAYSAGFDIGGLLHLDKESLLPENSPIDLLRVGAVVKNLAAKYPWSTGTYWSSHGGLGTNIEDKVPLTVVVGASALGLGRKLLLAADAEKTEYKTIKLNVGGELKVLGHAALRAGLAEGRPAFGLGLFSKFGSVDMEIDIALEEARNLGGWETIIGSYWQF
ncbi:MAG: PorV/PorQ family protein [bacterium]